MQLKQRHKIEEEFHDRYAQSIRVENVEPVKSFEAPTAIENQWVLAQMGRLKGKRVLDLGCGVGDAAVYFALQGAQVVAADISPEMVKVARKLARFHKVAGRVKVMKAVGEKLPFRDASFDFVYGNGVLHHLDLEVSAPEIARVLKPGGKGLFIEPLGYNPVIAVYRRIAAGVRTTAEQPVSYAGLKRFGGSFRSLRLREMHLLTLGIFLWFFFGLRVSPNKERYWKKIIYEGEKYRRSFGLLYDAEKILLKILPFLKPLCWNVVVACVK